MDVMIETADLQILIANSVIAEFEKRKKELDENK
jgi:hypothetical protein